MISRASQIPSALLLGLIRIYQKTASPAISVFWGAGAGCKFVPSCSEYAAQAVRTHGALQGSLLAAGRLCRCMPFVPGGLDPVPPAARPRPRPACLRTA